MRFGLGGGFVLVFFALCSFLFISYPACLFSRYENSSTRYDINVLVQEKILVHYEKIS